MWKSRVSRKAVKPERMYVYNYRIYDRYKRTVVSLAVLGDERRSWKPFQFGYELWGCEVNFKFPVVKLRLLQTTVECVRSQPQPQCLGGHGAFEGARNTQEMQLGVLRVS